MTRRTPADDQFSEAELRWLYEQREIDKRRFRDPRFREKRDRMRRRAVARIHRWAGRTLTDSDFQR